MANEFDFENLRNQISALLQEATEKNDFDHFVNGFSAITLSGWENDMKSITDQVFRDFLSSVLQRESYRELLERVITLSIHAAESDICSGSLPVLLLSDMFDCVTLEKCEELFAFVEDRVHIWKKELFYRNCKNQILRSCNDLLRRLSRSQNTVFCGRILVFLARFFPLSERSGLNIISEFNLDNVTLFSSKDDIILDLNNEKDETMEEGEMDDTVFPITVDYNLYRKFWSLQEFFRQPNLCYNKVSWRHFASYSGDVLSAFGSFKLDDIKSVKWKLAEASPGNSGKSDYFAKYLTSQKLLELELSDSNFRRYILIQFLILFQYLNSSVRFKQETYVLTEEQQTWAKDTAELVYKLLEETPPNGSEFSKHVALILKREEYWNNWKNEGCPDFKDAVVSESLPKANRSKRKLGEDFRSAALNKKVLVGNAELNRLWNLCQDNWEACRSKARDFVPTLENFFEPAIEEANPANQTENAYKKINNSNYGWRALRVLSHKSPHFFTHSNQQIKNVPLYLQSMVTKLAKELPLSQTQSQPLTSQEDIKTEESSVAGDGADDSDDELLKNSEDASSKEEDKFVRKPNPFVTRELAGQIAVKLQKDWKKLAQMLEFSPDEIEYFESEHEEIADQAKNMLTVWVEQEEPTISILKRYLEESKLWIHVKDLIS